MKFVHVLFLLLVVALSGGQELRIVASHAALTEKQAALLTIDKAKLKDQAAKLGFTVLEKGEDVMLYDDNMYDLLSMEKCIRGHAVVAELMRAKKYTFKLSDLSAQDREAVRQLFVQGGRDLAYGPVVYNDNFPIRLQVGYACDMEAPDGAKRQTWAYEDNLAPPVDTKTYPSFTKEEIERFQNEGARKLRKPVDINTVVLTYGQKKQISVERRMEAAQNLLDTIRAKVAEQFKAYQSGLKSLEESFSSSRAPKKGMAVRGIDPDSVTGLTAEHFKALGFNSKEEAEAFLGSAKFTGVRPCVRFEMGFRDGSRLTQFSFDSWVNRGG